MRTDTIPVRALAVMLLAFGLVVAGAIGAQRARATAMVPVIPYGIVKFTDGAVTCYASPIIGGYSISCIK